jgi:hypothetical protein
MPASQAGRHGFNPRRPLRSGFCCRHWWFRGFGGVGLASRRGLRTGRCGIIVANFGVPGVSIALLWTGVRLIAAPLRPSYYGTTEFAHRVGALLPRLIPAAGLATRSLAGARIGRPATALRRASGAYGWTRVAAAAHTIVGGSLVDRLFARFGCGQEPAQGALRVASKAACGSEGRADRTPRHNSTSLNSRVCEEPPGARGRTRPPSHGRRGLAPRSVRYRETFTGKIPWAA